MEIQIDGFEIVTITKKWTGLPFDILADSVGKDRNIGNRSQCIKIIEYDWYVMELSFYDEPKIEFGEHNICVFGEDNIDTMKRYLAKHRALFLAHWNHDIGDGELCLALNFIRKNSQLSDEEAILQAKKAFE